MFNHCTKSKLTNFAALVATASLATASLAGVAQAQGLPHYFLNMTESATGLDVTSDLPNLGGGFSDNSFNPDVAPGGENTWYFGPTYGGFALFFPTHGGSADPSYYAIAWQDPGASTYNVLFLSPSGNRGNMNFEAMGNLSGAELNSAGFNQSCYAPGGGYMPCPVLADSQTFTTDISYYFVPTGSLSITFSDQSSPGGVPEPAAWALMIGGFGVAGAALRRRRSVVGA